MITRAAGLSAIRFSADQPSGGRLSISSLHILTVTAQKLSHLKMRQIMQEPEIGLCTGAVSGFLRIPLNSSCVSWFAITLTPATD